MEVPIALGAARTKSDERCGYRLQRQPCVRNIPHSMLVRQSVFNLAHNCM